MLIRSRFIPIVQRNARREVERSAVSLLLQELSPIAGGLAYTLEGKPYLSNEKNWHISISHTEGLVMLALSKEPIGIDVERISDRLESVRRILTPSDLAYIEAMPKGMHRSLYALTWTAAEALFKLVDESRLISDFSYDWSTLTYCTGRYYEAFTLEAYYKPNHDIRLKVSSLVGQIYAYSVAKYIQLVPLLTSDDC